MKVKFYPQFDDKWNELRKAAYLVMYPESYDSTKKYFWFVDVHGVGERGNCQLENLENLLLGWKQSDGTRKYAYITEDTQKAVDKYDIIFVYPTYSPKEFFGATKMDTLYDLVRKEWSVTPEFSMGGFSYGGGATVNSASSANAHRIITAWPIAPTNNVGGYLNQQDMCMHFFVNDEDDNAATNLSVTKGLVSKFGFQKIKPQYTAFRESGHGGHNRATTQTPPIAPGGQGVIDLSENIYEWSLDVHINGPRAMKRGTFIPTIPTTPTSPTIVKAIASYSGSGPTFTLNGTASTGLGSGIWPRWTVKKAPDGVNLYSPMIKSAGAISTSITFPQKGEYIIEFALLNNSRIVLSSTEFTINYGDVVIPDPVDPTPIEKKIIDFSFINKMLKFDDGSFTTIESATFKTLGGEEYTI